MDIVTPYLYGMLATTIHMKAPPELLTRIQYHAKKAHPLEATHHNTSLHSYTIQGERQRFNIDKGPLVRQLNRPVPTAHHDPMHGSKKMITGPTVPHRALRP